jgi:hypothetical protein
VRAKHRIDSLGSPLVGLEVLVSRVKSGPRINQVDAGGELQNAFHLV